MSKLDHFIKECNQFELIDNSFNNIILLATVLIGFQFRLFSSLLEYLDSGRGHCDHTHVNGCLGSIWYQAQGYTLYVRTYTCTAALHGNSIRGYHAYKDNCNTGEQNFDSKKEIQRIIMKDGNIVGHVPFNISRTVSQFLRRDHNTGFAEVLCESRCGLHAALKFHVSGPEPYVHKQIASIFKTKDCSRHIVYLFSIPFYELTVCVLCTYACSLSHSILYR